MSNEETPSHGFLWQEVQKAVKRCRRFTQPALARNAAENQLPRRVPVLHGEIYDDVAYFLVPATNRDAALLIRAGYELCDLRAPNNEDMW